MFTCSGVDRVIFFGIYDFRIAFSNAFLIALLQTEIRCCCKKKKALSRRNFGLMIEWRNACLEFEFGTSTRCRCHRNDVNPDGNSTHLGKVLWSSPICVQISVVGEKGKWSYVIAWLRGMKTTWTFHLFVYSIAMCFLVYIWMHHRVLFLPTLLWSLDYKSVTIYHKYCASTIYLNWFLSVFICSKIVQFLTLN